MLIHRKNPIRQLLGVAVLSLVLVGCSDTDLLKSGSTDIDTTINIGSLYEPQNLDDTSGGGQGVNEALNGNVYEGLFRRTDSGKIENLLATKTTISSDGLTYTFTLRSGVLFHSGKPLTSSDVKFSIERVMAPQSQFARKSSFTTINSIETPNASTVVINLKRRSISLVFNLTYVWTVNPNVKDVNATVDGTGPYKFVKWIRGSTLSLTRFDKYWGQPAKTKDVVFHYFKQESQFSDFPLTHSLDIVTNIEIPSAVTLFSRADVKINNGQSTTKLLFAFNDRIKPFNNPLVRKAVTSAINREVLLRSIWGSYGTVIGSMVPPTDPWFEDLTKVNPYDLELAKKELVKAGYPHGFSFVLDTPNYDPHPDVAIFIKSELAKIGINVTVNLITPDEWYSRIYRQKNFVATLQEHVNSRDIIWYGDPDFYWGYKNLKVTQLIQLSEEALTADAQTSLLKQANRIIVQDAASDWLFLYPQMVVAMKEVSGYSINGLDSQFFAFNIVKK